jgi:MscS family membrane protein
MWLIALFFVAWLIFAIGEIIADVIIGSRHIHKKGIDASLITITVRVASLGIALWVVLEGAERIGLSLIPLVAGLGIGGLAVALAVRPTFENLIGGFILYIDKPVAVGDRCIFGNQEGFVEQIGLRSTRIRTLKETLVSVPNAEFAHLQLENVSIREMTLYQTVLGLRYETTADQLRYVLTRLREAVVDHPMVAPKRLRVRFLGFGDYSLNIEIFAYFRTKKFEEYWGLREDLNLRIIDIVKEAGTSFAFPSSTAYLGEDAGLDEERTRSAETKVEDWRTAGALRMEEFDEARRRPPGDK